MIRIVAINSHILILNGKQCRSRSVGFFRSQLIWIYTVCKDSVYPGSAGQRLRRLFSHPVLLKTMWRTCKLLLLVQSRLLAYMFAVSSILQQHIKPLYRQVVQKAHGAISNKILNFKLVFSKLMLIWCFTSISTQDTKIALYCSPDYQTSFESIGRSVQENKFNIDFQNGHHLGFPIRMILATFDIKVTSILPMQFQVNCPFGSG